MKAIALLALVAAGCSAQESMLLVLEKGGSALAFCSPAGECPAVAPVGEHPHEIVLSPDGRFAYVSDNGTMRIEQAGSGGNTVSIVDLAARRKVGEISLGRFRRPHGLALDAKSGLLAVTTELPDQLVLVDVAARRVVRTVDTQGKTSHMVALGRDGRFAYVSNSGSASVSVVDLRSGAVKVLATGARPEGSMTSRDGRRVYVCNREAAAITIIDTATNEVAGTIATGKGPVRIAETPDGKLVYAAMHDRRVELADPETRKVLRVSAKLEGDPVSLHLSADGKLAFASAEEMDLVYRLSVPDLKIVGSFRMPKGSAPDPVLEKPGR